MTSLIDPAPTTDSKPSADAAVSQNRVSDGKSGRANIAALGFFLSLALAAVAVNSISYHSVVQAGIAAERGSRMQAPDDGTGAKGRCSALAKDALPPMFDPDSFCWINLVNQEIQDGAWRSHATSSDNVPLGREAHWSSSFAIWIRLMGGIARWTGLAGPQAIAAGAAWANPALMALSIVILGYALWRRTGVWTAGILTVTLAASWGVEWDFNYGRPDHHGLHLIAFMGMLLCALGSGLGWVREHPGDVPVERGPDAGGDTFIARPATQAHARRWLTLSGIFGGAGLWIGATQQMFVIGSVGAMAAIGALIFVRKGAGKTGAGDVRFEPGLWRRWARAGAFTSLAFYLLEYFPNHLGMRLEVNHPLYALAWLGGGELIYAAGTWANGGPRDGRWFMGIAFGLLCVAGLPVAVICGPTHWYVLRNPVLLRTMQTVTEGRPFIEHWTLEDVWKAVSQLGALWVALPAALALLCFRRRTLPPWRQTALLVAGLPCVVCLGWLFLQCRWLGFACAALAVLAVVVAPVARREEVDPVSNPAIRRREAAGLPWILLALTVPGWAGYCEFESSIGGDRPALHVNELLEGTLAAEETGWNLKLYQGDNPAPARAIAPLGISTDLAYWGGTRTLGSLYWENTEGVRVQERFYTDSAPGEPDARRIARERGLDYVVVMSDPSSIVQAQWIDQGKIDPATLPGTLIYRLSNPLHPQPPDWLEPLPLVDAPLAVRYGMRLYRVRRDRL